MMKTPKHPDQNPEESQTIHLEENPQSEVAENTTLESAIDTEVTEVELLNTTKVVADIKHSLPVEAEEIQELAAPVPKPVTEKIPEAVVDEVNEVVEPEVKPVQTASDPVMEIKEEIVESAEPEAEATIEVVKVVKRRSRAAVKPIVSDEPEAEATIEVVKVVKRRSRAAVKPIVSEAVSETEAIPVVDEKVADIVTDDSETLEDSIEEEVAATEAQEEDYSKMSREQLVSMLEEVVHNEDVNEIKNRIALIKVAYLAIANLERQDIYEKMAGSEEAVNIEAEDPLDERYKAAFAIYKHNKFKFNEDQEKIKIQNLEAKKMILDELKVLISSEETLKKTYDEFKTLQDQWKEIGMVPKTEAQGLWQNYHFLIEKFFDKVKINKELKDLDLRKNLEHKIELCEKAEELVLEPSITKSFKRLQELHDEWKEIGPVAQDKREEVWDRFKTATEKINDRRHDFYKKIQGDLDANYAAKVVLCEKAEQVVAGEYNSIKQWQDSTHQINELLKMWKSIGQAPQKVNNEIWNRFKAHLDQYFTNKKDYFNKVKDQQLHNYNLKVDLCLQAETHKLSTDWKNSSRELIRLQEEWKRIGPVPRKHSDKIWKRFRTACDEFFNTKNEFFKNLTANEGENLKHKVEIISQLNAFEYSDNKQASLAKVKELQREWMETGHVPIKEKDRIQAEFKAAVDKIYEKLKVDSYEVQNINYRSRFDSIKEQPDASRIINRERTGLQTKIDSLKEEILLWENNIGFFARSKQANLLKTEFEGKIARAKEELASLEAKMKFLRNAAKDQQ